MKVSVIADDGTECFSYDTKKESLCLHPNQPETPAVVESLLEATRFLASPATPRPPDRA